MKSWILMMLFLANANFLGAGELDEWNMVGNANWAVSDKVISANTGNGFLVSKKTYKDFELKLDFRPGKNSNSGVFFRCSSASNISDSTCYEANIFDRRPDPSGRTGAIVNVASPQVSINTEDQWNTYEVSAHGDHLVVKLNGVVTVDTRDARMSSGPVALQFAAGEIQFRNISIYEGRNIARDIVGVWELKSFELDDGKGNIKPWCSGAYGSIIYFTQYMSVAINCASDKEKRLLYSGPYTLEGKTVVHKVRNYNDASLLQVFRRDVVMTDKNHLSLIGQLGTGKVTVAWERSK